MGEEKILEEWDPEIAEKELSQFFEKKEAPVGIGNRQLLAEALTHRSYLSEHPGEVDNRKIAVLGDALLDLVVSKYLFASSSNAEEMTTLRSRLVNNKRLAQLARHDNLDRYLRLSKGERHQKAKPQRIMSNAYEALVGFVFLDSGLDAAERFVHRAIIETKAKME